MPRADFLAKFQEMEVSEAFHVLEQGFAKHGLEVSFATGGPKKAATFRRGGFSPFSVIATLDDLNFYIREPALKWNPNLAKLADKHHAGRVNIKKDDSIDTRNDNETRIRIKSAEEADQLMSWLSPLVPQLLS